VLGHGGCGFLLLPFRADGAYMYARREAGQDKGAVYRGSGEMGTGMETETGGKSTKGFVSGVDGGCAFVCGSRPFPESFSSRLKERGCCGLAMDDVNFISGRVFGLEWEDDKIR